MDRILIRTMLCAALVGVVFLVITLSSAAFDVSAFFGVSVTTLGFFVSLGFALLTRSVWRDT